MITDQQLKKTSYAIDQLQAILEITGCILYCFLCEVLVSLPLYIMLYVLILLDKIFDYLFAEPQDGKPTTYLKTPR